MSESVFVQFVKEISLTNGGVHSKKAISSACKPFLVAEIGLNHNGNLHIAKELITAAKDSGADAVKFQSYTTEKFINRVAPRAENLFHIFKQYELSFSEHVVLKEFADSNNILFFSTPLSLDWVDLLDTLEVCAYKVASGDLNNIRLLEKIVKKNKPVFISTGAAYFSDIKKSISFFRAQTFAHLVVLHCVSLYPTPMEKINLHRMLAIEQQFDVIPGFSDHTLGTRASEYASCMGACMIEKHFTMDKNLPGPDHHLSVMPEELAKIRENIDTAFEVRKQHQRDSWSEEFEADYWGKRSLYKIDGEIIPMRPRQEGLPKDSEDF